MILSDVFERFAQDAPLSVMAQGIMENALNPQILDQLFEDVAEKQFTQKLLFSTIVDLMSVVVCRIRPSIHAAFQARAETVGATIDAVYDKLDGTETAVEFAIDPAKFHDAFAADLPPAQTAVMAATQRPAAELAFSEPSGPPAWRSTPAWAVVATGDKAAGTDVVRSMAERAGATITEAEGSHVIMVSQPGAVAEVIMTAAAAVDRPAAAAGG